MPILLLLTKVVWVIFICQASCVHSTVLQVWNGRRGGTEKQFRMLVETSSCGRVKVEVDSLPRCAICAFDVRPMLCCNAQRFSLSQQVPNLSGPGSARDALSTPRIWAYERSVVCKAGPSEQMLSLLLQQGCKEGSIAAQRPTGSARQGWRVRVQLLERTGGGRPQPRGCSSIDLCGRLGGPRAMSSDLICRTGQGFPLKMDPIGRTARGFWLAAGAFLLTAAPVHQVL